MVSHGVPPPPATHHSPCHVFAALSKALDSNPREGSPGTVYVRQTSLPVCASYAEIYPRTPNSAPAFPMRTIPLAMRGAPVIAQGLDWSTVRTSQMGVPDLASRAMSRPSSVPTYTLPW